MKAPWYISTALSLFVTLLTLYLCTRNHDITTPPTPDEIAQALNKWRADNPTIRDTKLSPKPPVSHTEKKTVKPSEQESIAEQISNTQPNNPELEASKPIPRARPVLDIPEASPSLSFLTDRDLSTYELSFYAEDNLKKGNHQLARLAYERMIDFAKNTSPEEREKAAAAILALKAKTPLWNPDPSTRSNISLTLNTSSLVSEDSTAIVNELKQLIIDSSDGTLTPSIKITTSSAPLSSLRLAGAAPVTFVITEESDIRTKLFTALYNVIRNKNNQSQELTTSPPLPTHISPEQALQSYITRLTWLNAAQ